ncbi:enoyl-CoA hydratase-related protein [Variovorax defluvii]
MTHREPDSPLLVRCDQQVLTIELASGQPGHPLTVAMTEHLADALEDAARRTDIHCVVLQSQGRHFCSGGNVKDMRDGADLMQGGVADVRDRLRRSLHRLPRALQAIEVPTIAAVQGAAVGAGCDLALMCDIRIASVDASFAESFLRLGLVSGIGGAWFLTRIVGLSKALEMSFTSEFLGAEAAERCGIVSEVVARDALHARAAEMAARIAANPPTAMRMAKKLVRESAASSLPTALEMAASMQAILLCGDEHKQRVRQFLDADAAHR